MFSTDVNSTTIAMVENEDRFDGDRLLLLSSFKGESIAIIYSYYAGSETQLDASTRKNGSLESFLPTCFHSHFWQYLCGKPKERPSPTDMFGTG